MFIYSFSVPNKMKAAESQPQFERAAHVLKAVAHPLRIKVLSLLDEYHELGVTQLVDLLKVEQSLASHHLTKMHDKGVLKMRREGKNRYYSLANDALSKILKCIHNCKTF